MIHRLGLVLSGGGSRGLAHAGVLEALAEHGIEVDCISGTSAGALVGALHAAGHRAAGILRFFEATTPFHVSHIAPPGRRGWIDTGKIEREFRTFFPEDAFEALNKPLFVTATDLVSGNPRIFSSGPLIRPLLASASIPALFTPTRFEGGLYVDGGVLDNFPVGPLEGRCRAILGVHASPLPTVTADDMGSFLAVTQRAVDIGIFAAARSRFSRVDLVIHPQQLETYSTIDPGRHEEILQIGHRAALACIDEIRELARRPA